MAHPARPPAFSGPTSLVAGIYGPGEGALTIHPQGWQQGTVLRPARLLRKAHGLSPRLSQGSRSQGHGGNGGGRLSTRPGVALPQKVGATQRQGECRNRRCSSPETTRDLDVCAVEGGEGRAADSSWAASGCISRQAAARAGLLPPASSTPHAASQAGCRQLLCRTGGLTLPAELLRGTGTVTGLACAGRQDPATLLAATRGSGLERFQSRVYSGARKRSGQAWYLGLAQGGAGQWTFLDSLILGGSSCLL